MIGGAWGRSWCGARRHFLSQLRHRDARGAPPRYILMHAKPAIRVNSQRRPPKGFQGRAIVANKHCCCVNGQK